MTLAAELEDLAARAQAAAAEWAARWAPAADAETQALVAVATAVAAVVAWLLASPWPSAVRRRGARFHDEPRRVLVTGAASGVGRQLCGALLARGHQVVATDRDFRSLKKAAQADAWLSDPKFACKLKPLDVTQTSDWQSTIRYAQYWVNGLDLLINAAGYVKPGDLSVMSAMDIDLQIDVNFKGTVLGTQEASRLMQFQAANEGLPIGGQIVNFSCLNALALAPGCSLYSASKHAVRGFSLCAAKELAPEGIFVTVVCPDTIATPMAAQLAQHEGCAQVFSEPLRLEAVQDIFLRKVLLERPAEVIIAGSRRRKLYAVLSNYYHSSRLVAYYERVMQHFARPFQETSRI